MDLEYSPQNKDLRRIFYRIDDLISRFNADITQRDNVVYDLASTLKSLISVIDEHFQSEKGD